MKIDEMRSAWAEMERRLAAAEATSQRLEERNRLDTARWAVRGIGWGQVLEILIWIAVIGVVAPFWIENRHNAALLLSGLAIHIYGIATICLSVVQLLLVLRISFATPIVELQNQLLELRRFRIRAGRLLALPWWILWVLGLAVLVANQTGIDLYAVAPTFMIANLVFGALGMVGTVVLARRKGRHPGRFFASLADDMAGHRLTKTTNEFAELEAFAQG